MARRKARASLAALACATLMAQSFLGLPSASATEESPSAFDSSEAADRPPQEESESGNAEPPYPASSVSASPSPEGAAPTPAESPSEPTGSPESPSLSPSSSPSPSPSADEAEEGAAIERIIQVASADDIDRLVQEARDIGGEVLTTYESVITGFAARLSPKDALYLAEQPGVVAIEQNQEFELQAGAVRTDSFCTTNSLGKIDDGSTLGVSIGFDVNWFGVTYDEVLINNNGGISFNDGAGRFDYWSGINLETTDRPLLLPLFTDIDTRNASASAVTYGTGTIGGKNALCVNWVNVGEYYQSAPKFSFQLVIIDQSASGNAGDADIEFNYDEVGTPQSNTNGKFVVGYAVPHSRTDTLVRVSSNDSPSLYVDGGALSLVGNRYPTSGSTAGRYTFEIRPDGGGSPPAPDPTPTPITAAGNCDGENNPSTTLPGYSYTYCNVVWGLDRIDQRVPTLNDEFSPAGDGTGVRAYIVDTGLNTTHNDFTGRVGTGRNFYGTSASGDTSINDCNGHGTHVASTLAGSTYGVAKKATVIPIRVFGCSGSTSTTTIINALDWIADNHPGGTPGVVNMSLGGGVSTALDNAVKCLTGTGSGCGSNSLTVVVAAGNSNTDANYTSPARVNEAITVGSTTSQNQRSYFSNYGSAVDIFAPGSSITAAWIGSTTATRSISGTSMASPHVAGAAAVYLGANTSASPSQVLTELVADATSEAITNTGPGSPNKLLFIGGLAIVTGISPNSGSSGAAVTITGENLDAVSGSPSVTFAGASASVSSETDTELQLQAPSAPAGAADVVINNGLGAQTITSAFTFTSGSGTAPTISAIDPSSGPIAGGTTVTITGSNLVVPSQNTSVLFGSVPATVTSATADEVVIRTPASSAGAVNVTVVTSEGQGTESAGFTYVAPPSISSLSVSSGPIAGNTSVTLTGANLSLTSSLTVGGVAANFTIDSATSLVLTTPPRPSSTANSYDVVLTTPGGSATVVSGFTYVAAPTISSIASIGQLGIASTPLTGPAEGGTGVRILGSNLNEVTSVEFGSRSATFTRESSTSIVAISPSGTGLVDLVVTSPGGSGSLTNAFQYDAPLSGGGGSSGGGSSGGGGSGGGGGSSSSSDEGGGGGLQSISTIVPSDSGPSGSVIALAGWGFETTRAVLFNDVPAQFTVINGGHVEVIVPDLAPGVYVIHAVLAPEIGRASFWDGYRVTGRGSSVSASAVVEKEPPTLVQSPSDDRVELLTFNGKRVKLSRSVRAELAAIAEASTASSDEALIIAYTNKRETKASVRRAKKRARNIERYLARSGFRGTISTQTEPGKTKAQRRGARIFVGTNPSVTT